MKIVPFGILPVDKPMGMTSRRVVDIVQPLVGTDRVGHAGTLDPLATGVLLIAIGNATRLVEYLHELHKVYVATFEFGKTSSTLDSQGDVTTLSLCEAPSIEALTEECQKWLGRVQQSPPRFSAVRIGGSRSYKLARAGRQFQPPAREVEIFSIEIMKYDYPELTIRVCCGSGTYIRSLGHDIATGLGDAAIMTGLVRTSVGPYGIETAAKVDQLRTLDDVVGHLWKPETGLVDWARLDLNPSQAKDVRDGRAIDLRECDRHIPRIAAFDPNGLLAILVNDSAGHWKALRVFHKIAAANQPTASKAKHSPES